MERKTIGIGALRERTEELLEQERPRKLMDASWVLEDGSELRELSKKSELRFLKSAILIFGAALILLLASFAGGYFAASLEDSLRRPAYGEDARSLSLGLELSYGDKKQHSELEVDVQPKGLTEAEADALFSEIWDWLPGAMYKGSLSSVSTDLELPQSYGDKAELWWESPSSSIVREDGYIDFISASQGQRALIRCTAKAGEYTESHDFAIIIDKDGADLRGSFEERARILSERLSEDDEGESLQLPREEKGAVLSWKLERESAAPALIAVAVPVILFLYFSRYDGLERELKRKREAFSREIPNMSLQLILLLNAGLVASSAFEELVHENKGSDNPLYIKLGQALQRSKDSNSSFTGELYELARKSEDKDFIRFANLVYENSARGSQLVEKLERERSSMWQERISKAKGRAKQAETKLSFPLVLLLFAIVLISVSPALLRMN